MIRSPQSHRGRVAGLRTGVGVALALGACFVIGLPGAVFAEESVDESVGRVGDRGNVREEPAEEVEGDEEFGWSPAFAFGFGGYTQSISGDTTSTQTDFPRQNGDSLISVALAFEGKLYTPLQLEIPGKPRLFLSGGVHLPLAEELIAERIDQDEINRYAPGANNPSTNLLLRPDDSAFIQPDFQALCPDSSLTQTGAPATNPFSRFESCALRIRNQVTVDAMWLAGFGIEFEIPTPALDSTIRIRPSLEYYGMAIQTVGRFVRTSGGVTLDDEEQFASGVGDAEIYHGLSPALAVSADVYEVGPLRWSMYLQGRAIFYFDDPAFTADSAIDTGSITWISAADDLAFYMGGGIQVQWTGKR